MNQSLLSNRYLFLDYLNRRYGDPNAKARALDRLRSLKQKPDESFASFFPKFEKELADSGGGEWADVVQINYLEGAINNRLKSSLVSAIASISTNDNKAASRGQERNGLGTRESKSVDKRQEGPGGKAICSVGGAQMLRVRKLGHLAAKCPGKERRQQRVKERAKAEAEWATQKDEMDCEGLYVNFGINRVFHHGLR
ncbi:reverse transcriptase (RNA-dependent DNA polymerase) [Hirsutella rhossiliensis]